MKRLLIVLAIVAGALALPRAAEAACGSIPYVFQNTSGTNSIVDATTTNANNSFLQACATQVDNTQIGPAGIFPSQVVPSSTATGTFGSGTSQYPFTFGLGTATQVPLSILGYTGQSADVFDVWNTASKTVKWAWIDSSGVLHLAFAPVGPNGGTFLDTSSTAQTKSGALTVGAFTAAGVNVGGALTGATTGAFSSTVTTGLLNAQSGSTPGTVGQAIQIAGVSVLGGNGGGQLLIHPLIEGNGITFQDTNANQGYLSITPTATSTTINGGGGTSIAGMTTGSFSGAVSTGALTASSLTSNGGVAVGGALTGATSGSFSAGVSAGIGATNGFQFTGTPVIYSDGGKTNTYIAAPSSGNNVYIQSFAGASNAHFPDAGGLVLDRGSLSVGSSTISSTSATLGGSLAISGALTGATTVNASGLGTFVGLTAGTGTVQGSSNGSTTGYVPPVYNASGAALASTTHIVLATGQTCTTGSGGVCSFTISFTGAAVFGANTYGCTVWPSAPSSSGNLTVQTQTKATTSDALSIAGNALTTYTFDVYCVGA